MAYGIVLSKKASRTLEGITSELRSRLNKAIEGIADDPYTGKHLHGKLDGLLSVRVGDWRIVYEVDSKSMKIVIHGIGTRGQVYKM